MIGSSFATNEHASLFYTTSRSAVFAAVNVFIYRQKNDTYEGHKVYTTVDSVSSVVAGLFVSTSSPGHLFLLGNA